ncbi:MAG: universal stress protein, partial [Chloroflexota bacterium]
MPLDGSSLAERALPLAVSLARASRQELKLVEALKVPVSVEPLSFDGVEAAAKDYVDTHAANIHRDRGLMVSTDTPFGDAASVIVDEARSGAVSCIVMTTHGREGLRRAVLGSVAEHVLRASPVPVWLLPAAAEDREPRPIKHILVPLDGSALSEAVLPTVARWARTLSASLTLCRVYDAPKHAIFTEQGQMISSIDQEVDRAQQQGAHYLHPLITKLRAAGIEAVAATELGRDPAVRVLEIAVEGHAD